MKASMEKNPVDRQAEKDTARRLVEQKIDEFNEATFPASDPPSLSSLKDIIAEAGAEPATGERRTAPMELTNRNQFSAEIENIRRRARERVELGAVTSGYACDLDTALGLLNDALASEIVCVLRYNLHYQMASGLASESIANEFLEHAREEQNHVDWIATRISQLNGEPNFSPEGLKERAKTDYVRCESLVDMIKENLVAERIVIDIYRAMISYFGNGDATTRRLFERILREEEEHAEDLKNLLPSAQANGAH
jgi:bacterioferritin